MKTSIIKEELSRISKLVQPSIDELLSESVITSHQVMALHQCASGGKRIRPSLVVLSGMLFGAKENSLLYPAAAIEILHNSTLIADDIIDHSDFRRNQPTVWKEFGQSMAECMVLDYVPSVFAGLADSNNSKELIKLYAKTLKVVVDGEIMDILFERSGREEEGFVVKNRYKEISIDDYLSMINKKTATLIEASCVAGALVAGANTEQMQAIGEYGHNIGMAFQIQDDILDIFADEKEFGKKVGKDIIEKKLGNFVILSSIQELSQKDKERVLSVLDNPKQVSDSEANEVIELIDKTNAKETAQKTANNYVQAAIKSLKNVPQNKYTEYLSKIANYIVERES